MKVTWSLISLVVYITYFFAYGDAQVGVISEETVYSWALPWELALYIAIPAFLGYMVGKQENEND